MKKAVKKTVKKAPFTLNAKMSPRKQMAMK